MSRLSSLRRLLKEQNADALWVTSAENHLYYSSFDNPDGELLITQDNAWLFADFRYSEAARREALADFTVIQPEGKRSGWLPKLLQDNGIHTLGYEDANLTVSDFHALQEDLDGLQLSYCAVSKPLNLLRSVKTRDEVEKIVKAQRIAEEAFTAVLALLTPKMTEMEVAAELEYQMKKRGSKCPSFETIAVSGTASSSPHGVPRPVPLEHGFLTMDFGAVVDGYHSDMTRTVVIGRADTEIIRVYNTVLQAQNAAFAVLRAGTRNADADAAARNVIDSAGYQGTFGHSLGHGVGLLIHEQPAVSARSERTLQVGEIVTVEPGIYLAGKYGCRIEDMAYITENGFENLTKAPKALIEVL